MGYYQQPPQGYYPQQQPYYPPPPQYSGCLKFFLYVLSFAIPLAGLILGLVYMSKGDPESKSLGTACLIIAIVSTILYCCVVVGFTVLPSIIAMLSQGSY